MAAPLGEDFGGDWFQNWLAFVMHFASYLLAV